MEKAYDMAVLVEKLKARGLDLAEEGAMIAMEETLAWLKESAAASENVYDDMLMSVVPVFKSEIEKQIDKIDGEVG